MGAPEPGLTPSPQLPGFLVVRKGKKRSSSVMDLENRRVVAKGEGEGVGWSGSLGLIDANYCL